MIQFMCPHCGEIYRLPDHQAGKGAQCACGKKLLVPPPLADDETALAPLVPTPLAPAPTPTPAAPKPISAPAPELTIPVAALAPVDSLAAMAEGIELDDHDDSLLAEMREAVETREAPAGKSSSLSWGSLVAGFLILAVLAAGGFLFYDQFLRRTEPVDYAAMQVKTPTRETVDPSTILPTKPTNEVAPPKPLDAAIKPAGPTDSVEIVTNPDTSTGTFFDQPPRVAPAPHVPKAVPVRPSSKPAVLPATAAIRDYQTWATNHRKALLEVVDEFRVPAASSPLCVWGRTAFAVAAAKNDRGEYAVQCAAAELGKGRVIAWPRHDGIIAPMKRFYYNAAKWLANSPAPTIAMAGNPKVTEDLTRYLRTKGCTVNSLPAKPAAADLVGIDVVFINTMGLRETDLAPLDEFVRQGGGAFVYDTHWIWCSYGWGKTVPRHERGQKHPASNFLREAGIAYLAGHVPETSPISKTLTPMTNGYWAAKALADGHTFVDADYPVMERAIGDTMWRFDRKADPKMWTEFTGVILAEANKFTGKKIIRAKQKKLSLCVGIANRLAMGLAPDELPEIKAAADFPGAVPADAKRETVSLSLDTRIDRWHSTGVYAAPGDVLTITVPPAMVAKGYHVRIGVHTDRLWHLDKWDRYPEISRRFAINATTLTVGNAFGGAVYIEVPKKTPVGTMAVKIAGGVTMPRYILGKSTPTTWVNFERTNPAPWAEIQGKYIIFTVPSKEIRTLASPKKMIAFWDDVMEAQDDLAGYTSRRTSHERYTFDKQISAGWMHSGYPLMAFTSWSAKIFNFDRIAKTGDWGCFHEIGHNHQAIFRGGYNNAWTFDGNTEVTVNIFSAYTYVKAMKKPKLMGHQHWRTDDRAALEANIRKNFKPGTPYAQQSHPGRCMFFIHFAYEFGYDTYEKIFAKYWELDPKTHPKTNLAKRSLFLEIASGVTKKNLAEFFTAYELETTDAAKSAVKNYPKFRPKLKAPTPPTPPEFFPEKK